MDAPTSTGIPTQPAPLKPWKQVAEESNIFSLPPEQRLAEYDKWSSQVVSEGIKNGDFDSPDTFSQFKLKDIRTRKNLASDDIVGPSDDEVVADYNAFKGAFASTQTAFSANKPTPQDEAIQGEVLQGKRKSAFLRGQMFFNPAVVNDPQKYREAILESDAPSDIKMFYAGLRPEMEKSATVTRRRELANNVITRDVADKVVTAIQEGTELFGMDIGTPQSPVLKKNKDGIWSVMDPEYVDQSASMLDIANARYNPLGDSQYKPLAAINEYQQKYGLTDEQVQQDYMESLIENAPTSVNRWFGKATSIEDYVKQLDSTVRVKNKDVAPEVRVQDPNLFFDPEGYNAAVDKAKAPDEAKNLAKEARTQFADAVAGDIYNNLLNNRDDFREEYAKDVVDRKDMEKAITRYYKDKKDQAWYDDVGEMFGQAGTAAWQGVKDLVMMPSAIKGMFGDVEAAENYRYHMLAQQGEMQAEEAVANRTGGAGFIKLNNDVMRIIPDLAVQMGIAVATGGTLSGAQTSLIAARTGISRAAATTALRQAALTGEKTALKSQLLRLIPEVTAKTVDDVAEEVLKASARTASNNPFKGGIGTQRAVGSAYAGLTSASSTFGQVYTDVRNMGKSPEEAIGTARTAAIVAGAITSGLTHSFGMLGRGGVEDFASMGRKAGEFTIKDIVNAGLADSLSTPEGRQLIRNIAKGFGRDALSEGAEEGLDQALNLISQYATNPSPEAQNRRATDIINESLYATLLGGIAGGGAASVGQARASAPGVTAQQMQQEILGAQQPVAPNVAPPFSAAPNVAPVAPTVQPSADPAVQEAKDTVESLAEIPDTSQTAAALAALANAAAIPKPEFDLPEITEKSAPETEVQPAEEPVVQPEPATPEVAPVNAEETLIEPTSAPAKVEPEPTENMKTETKIQSIDEFLGQEGLFDLPKYAADQAKRKAERTSTDQYLVYRIDGYHVVDELSKGDQVLALAKAPTKTEAARDTTKPEQMTPEELGKFQKSETVREAQEALDRAKSGKDKPGVFTNGFKSKAEMVRAKEADLAAANAMPENPNVWQTAVDAANNQQPIFAGLVESLDDKDQILSPGPAGEPGGTVDSPRKQLIQNLTSKGYVKQGELYVYQPEQKAEATAKKAPAKKPAKQPQPTKQDAVQEPSPDASVLRQEGQEVGLPEMDQGGRGAEQKAAEKKGEVKAEVPAKKTKRDKEVFAQQAPSELEQAPKKIILKAWRFQWAGADMDMELIGQGKDIDEARKSVRAPFSAEATQLQDVEVWNDWGATHQSDINRALLRNEPVSSEAVDLYGIKLPSGYIKQDDLYVFAEKPVAEPELTPEQNDVVVFVDIENDTQEKAVAAAEKKKRITPGKARKVGIAKQIDRLGITSNDPESVIAALEKIANNPKPKPSEKHHIRIAKDLITVLKDSGVRIQLVSGNDARMAKHDSRVNGWYDPSANTAYINLDGPHELGIEETILHELVHASGEKVIQNPQTDAQKRILADLEKQMLAARKNAIALGKAKLGTDVTELGLLTEMAAAQNDYGLFDILYGVSSLSEYHAHATTSRSFQKFLATYKEGGKRSLMERFINSITSLLSGKKTAEGSDAEKAYATLLDLMREGKGDVRLSNADVVESRARGVGEDAAFAELERRFKAGDKDAEEEARKLIEKMAKEQDWTEKAYHGTPGGGFTVFDIYGSRYGLMGQGAYFTNAKDVAQSYAENKGRKVDSDSQTPQVYEVFLKPGRVLDMEAPVDKQFWLDAFGDYLTEDSLSAAKTNEDAFRAMEEAIADEGVSMSEGSEIVTEGLMSRFDSVTHIGGKRMGKGENLHNVTIVFNSEQIKSADPFTYDDNGNLILPSERFQPESPDIRFSRARSIVSDTVTKFAPEFNVVDDKDGPAVFFDGRNVTVNPDALENLDEYEVKDLSERAVVAAKAAPKDPIAASIIQQTDGYSAYNFDSATRKEIRRSLAKAHAVATENGMAPLAMDLGAKLFEYGGATDAEARKSMARGIPSDEEYLAAVEAGDMEKAQEMVDAAAKAAGYAVKAFHGTDASFNKFDPNKVGKRFNADKKGFFFALKKDDSYVGGVTISAFIKPGKLYTNQSMENSGIESIDAGDYADVDEYVDGNKKALINGMVESGADTAIITDDPGFSGPLPARHHRGTVIVFDPNRIKSADPVTRDDAGNVIPLSQRFQPTSPDIRFSLSRGVSAEQDSEYLAAVSSGNEEKAKQMVDEAASDYERSNSSWFDVKDQTLGARYRGMEGYGVWMTRDGRTIPVENHTQTAKNFFGSKNSDYALQDAFGRGWAILRAIKAGDYRWGVPTLAVEGNEALTNTQRKNINDWAKVHGYEINWDLRNQRGVQQKAVIYTADKKVIPLSQRFPSAPQSTPFSKARGVTDDISEKYSPRNEEETIAAGKALSNNVIARIPELAVAAVRMKNNQITADEYADLVDLIDPFATKGPDKIPSNEKIKKYIAKDKADMVGNAIQDGKEVEFRIDIPTYNRSTAAGDTIYAVTAHEPVSETSKRVGQPISYLGIAKVINPTFMTRAISGKGSAVDIAAGAGKFPLATVKGIYKSIVDLPSDISDQGIWTEVGYNPIRSSYFVDTRSKQAVIGGGEAIMVGSRVFVKDAILEQRATGFTGGLQYSRARGTEGVVYVPTKRSAPRLAVAKFFAGFRSRGMVTEDTYEIFRNSDAYKREIASFISFIGKDFSSVANKHFGEGEENWLSYRIFSRDATGEVTVSKTGFKTAKEAESFATLNRIKDYTVATGEDLMNRALGSNGPTLSENVREKIEQLTKKGLDDIHKSIAAYKEEYLDYWNLVMLETQADMVDAKQIATLRERKQQWMKALQLRAAEQRQIVDDARKEAVRVALEEGTNRIIAQQQFAKSYLPDDLVHQIERSRAKIDELSGRLTKIEWLMDGSQLQMIIDAKTGVYVTRSYEAFETNDRVGYVNWLDEAYRALYDPKQDYDPLAKERIMPLVRHLKNNIIERRIEDLKLENEQRQVDEIMADLMTDPRQVTQVDMVPGQSTEGTEYEELVRAVAKRELLRRRSEEKKDFIRRAMRSLALGGFASNIGNARKRLPVLRKEANRLYDQRYPEQVAVAGIMGAPNALRYTLMTDDEAHDIANTERAISENPGSVNGSEIWTASISGEKHSSFYAAVNDDFRQNLDFITGAPSSKTGFSGATANDWKRLGDKILEHKNDVPAFLRTFLGERDNPLLRVSDTLLKQSHLIAVGELYQNLAKTGMAQGWIVDRGTLSLDGKKYAGWKTILDSEKTNQGYENNPFSGKYIDPVMADAINVMLAANQPSNTAFKAVAKFVGFALWGVTAGSVKAIIRNLLSAPSFLLNSGFLATILDPRRLRSTAQNVALASIVMKESMSSVAKVSGGKRIDNTVLKGLDWAWTGLLTIAASQRTATGVMKGVGTVGEFISQMKSKPTSEAAQQFYSLAVRLGVANDNVQKEAMERLLSLEETISRQPKDKNLGRFAKSLKLDGVVGFGSYLLGTIKSAGQQRSQLYGAPDDFTKILAWLNEMDSQARINAKDTAQYKEWKGTDGLFTNMPEHLVKLAADHTTDTIQSHSKVWAHITQFKKAGFGVLLAPFVAARAEFYRNAINAYRIGFQELRSKNGKERGYGAARIASAFLAHTVYAKAAGIALSMIFKAMADDDDVAEDSPEKREAIRKLGPEYAKNKNATYVVYKNGTFDWLDISFSDPFSFVSSSLNAARRGIDEKAVDDHVAWSVAKELMAENFGTFVSPQIAVGATATMISGYDPVRGIKIWDSQADTTAEKVQKAIAYYAKQAGTPGDVKSAMNIIKAARGIEENGRQYKLGTEVGGVFLGASVRTIKVTDMVEQKLAQAKDNLNTRVGALYEAQLRDSNDVDMDDVVAATETYHRVGQDAIRRMQKVWKAGETLLADTPGGQKMLRGTLDSDKVKMSKEVERAIVTGKQVPSALSPQTEQKVGDLGKKHGDDRLPVTKDTLKRLNQKP